MSFPDNSKLFVDESSFSEPTIEMKLSAAKQIVLLDKVNPKESLEILGILDDIKEFRG